MTSAEATVTSSHIASSYGSPVDIAHLGAPHHLASASRRVISMVISNSGFLRYAECYAFFIQGNETPLNI